MVDKVCVFSGYSKEDFEDPLKRKDKTNRPPPIVRIFQYFEDQWINGVNFQPKDWTCYDKKVRTNNNLESWNGQVNREGGNKKMHVLKLGRYLHKSTKNVEDINMRLHMWGVYDNYQKSEQKRLNDKINKVWDDYKAGIIRPWTLVKRAAVILGPCISTDVQDEIM